MADEELFSVEADLPNRNISFRRFKSRSQALKFLKKKKQFKTFDGKIVPKRKIKIKRI